LDLIVTRGEATGFLRTLRETAAVAFAFFGVGLAVLSARWPAAAVEIGAVMSNTGTATSSASNSRDRVVT
jgi:hypothetical protein